MRDTNLPAVPDFAEYADSGTKFWGTEENSSAIEAEGNGDGPSGGKGEGSVMDDKMDKVNEEEHEMRRLTNEFLMQEFIGALGGGITITGKDGKERTIPVKLVSYDELPPSVREAGDEIEWEIENGWYEQEEPVIEGADEAAVLAALTGMGLGAAEATESVQRAKNAICDVLSIGDGKYCVQREADGWEIWPMNADA